MGSLLEHAPVDSEPEDEALRRRNTRLGYTLFALYFLTYAVFVGLNAFAPDVVARSVGGITVAVWYGLGLIGLAMVLAVLYAWLCHAPERQPRDDVT